MRFRSFFADVLANLELAQPVYDERTDDESREQCSETGKSGAKGQISENAEWRKIVVQLQIQEAIEQSACVPLPKRSALPSLAGLSRLPARLPGSRHAKLTGAVHHHINFPWPATRRLP